MNVDADTIYCTFGDVNVSVWLDDVHIQHVADLNIREGWIERYVKGEDGNFIVNEDGDGAMMERLEGVVRLEIWGMPLSLPATPEKGSQI